MGLIQSAVKEDRPIFVPELFRNDHNAAARQLRAIMKIDREFALSLEYYNVQPGQNFANAELP